MMIVRAVHDGACPACTDDAVFKDMKKSLSVLLVDILWECHMTAPLITPLVKTTPTAF
jgi:hypothetical protein